MILTVSSFEIGTEKNLVFDGSSWSWSKSIPKNSLLWGFDHPNDIRDAAASLRLDLPDFWKTPWGIAQSYIQGKDSKVLWQYVMPFQRWRDHVENLASQLWINFTNKDNSYYVDTHLRNRRVIWQLSRPILSRDYYFKVAKKENGNLERFKPGRDDRPERSKYSFSKTVTGRMTIPVGPNILTLKKENRKIFKSRFKDGRIVEVDLQSAEPRVALALFGKSISGDIYENVSKSLGLKIDRKIAKIATLSALYGASQHSLRSQLNSNTMAIKVLESVKEYFSVQHLEKMISLQHKDFGYVSNTHGRKIFSEIPSVNHFIQSSTVDVAFDIFEALLEKIKEMKIEALPLYIIHDAIILDVNSSSYTDLVKICSEGFESKTTRVNFPVKIKEIK
tara:strand:+ start:200 stop:1372 length:1173 start_codon:yes stop_codon:yes gene_type:complete